LLLSHLQNTPPVTTAPAPTVVEPAVATVVTPGA